MERNKVNLKKKTPKKENTKKPCNPLKSTLSQAMFTERLKKNGPRIKITRETTNNQQKKYNPVKHTQKQQLSFTKTSVKVSLKILSLKA